MLSFLKACFRVLTVALLASCLAGCFTTSTSTDAVRYAGYQPDGGGRDLQAPVSGGTMTPPVDSGVPSADRTDVDSGGKRLKRGDKIVVYLRGIPKPEEVPNIINTLGEITMPHLGPVRVENMESSAAERMIEQRYVDEGIYRKLTVIIVAEEGEYFVRGEVKAPGRYTLSGERSLVQAIATAGGYTLYANRAKVLILRGERTFEFDVRKIENREAEDPLIQSGDVIVVKKRLV